QAADHRVARLRRAGNPLHLAQLRGARPHRSSQSWQPRQSGDVALWDGAVALHSAAGRRGDTAIAADHGHVAVESIGQRPEAYIELRAHAAAGHAPEAA